MAALVFCPCPVRTSFMALWEIPGPAHSHLYRNEGNAHNPGTVSIS